MKAAWYEEQGRAREVLVVGEMADPAPGPGEVRIALERSGINPGDVKKRSDAFGVGWLGVALQTIGGIYAPSCPCRSVLGLSGHRLSAHRH